MYHPVAPVASGIVLKYNVTHGSAWANRVPSWRSGGPMMTDSARQSKTESHSPPILIDPSDERRILDFRPVGFRDVVVLGRYGYAKAHEALPRHCHGKMIEICYLESGQQTYYVDNEPHELHGGDLFVTFPNEPHGSGKSPEGKGVLYWLLLRVPRRPGRFLSLPPTESRTVIDRLLCLPARQFSGSDRVGRVLRRVFEAYDRVGDPLRVIDLRNLLLRFVLDVLEASRQSRPSVSPAIRRVQQAVSERLDKPIRVAELARLAHLSQSRFKARFKAEVGVPPADYALRQRIERAKAMLAEGDLPVTQIAARLGFSSTQYFATVFRRYTGKTPSDYRHGAR